MRIAIDAVGRLVLPKPLRGELGIDGPAQLEVTARDGVIELAVADLHARVADHDGTPVIVTDEPAPPLTAGDVRTAVERLRRRRRITAIAC